MHFFANVCRLYASVCRFAKVNPSAIVCNLYTFFSINYFCYNIYIYISNTSKKSETSETDRIDAVFKGETEVKQSETSETDSNNQHFNKFFLYMKLIVIFL